MDLVKTSLELSCCCRFDAKTCKIDPTGNDDEKYLLELLEENDVQHLIYQDSFDATIILVGTKDSLRQVLFLWDAYGRDKATVVEALANWDGSDAGLTEILF